MIFAYFAILNKLNNFVLQAKFYIRYETYPNLKGRALAINTELTRSPRAVQEFQVKLPKFGDF